MAKLSMNMQHGSVEQRRLRFWKTYSRRLSAGSKGSELEIEVRVQCHLGRPVGTAARPSPAPRDDELCLDRCAEAFGAECVLKLQTEAADRRGCQAIGTRRGTAREGR